MFCGDLVGTGRHSRTVCRDRVGTVRHSRTVCRDRRDRCKRIEVLEPLNNGPYGPYKPYGSGARSLHGPYKPYGSGARSLQGPHKTQGILNSLPSRSSSSSSSLSSQVLMKTKASELPETRAESYGSGARSLNGPYKTQRILRPQGRVQNRTSAAHGP